MPIEYTKDDLSPLPPSRAFVIQFRIDSDLAAGGCCGRIEHVTSGRVTHFTSLDELLGFATWILAGHAHRRSD